jgi:hypothetical protein
VPAGRWISPRLSGPTPTSFNAAESGAWRDFDDRAEREDQIGPA